MSETVSDRLRGDPRVAEARRLLHEAWSDHRRAVTGPRPADPGLTAGYDDAIAELERLRGGGLYYPYIGSGFGSGALVELADGSVKYDMITGIGVHAFGHGHARLVDAAFDAALADVTMQGNLQQNDDVARFSRLLLALAGGDQGGSTSLAHCFVTTSGAMANENALKMVLQKRSPADRVLALAGCFMGRTLAMSQVTDRAAYRDGLPTVLAVDYVPFFDAGDPVASTRASVAALEAHLRRHPGKHAAMCFELVLGEGGYWPGSAEFFAALMDVVKQHDVPVWVDEIQTFGRTDRPFAFQHFGLDRYVDIVTVGKVTQTCATLFCDDLKPRPALVSQTFTGATASLLTGIAVLEELGGGDYFGPDGRIAEVRRRFVERFEAISSADAGRLSGPFGYGVMLAATVFDGSADVTKRTLRRLFDSGVVAFAAGADPARLRFLPPVGATTDDDVDAVCEILARTLGEIASEGA